MSQCYYVTMSHSKYVTKVIEIYSPCSSLKLIKKCRHHSGIVFADNTVGLAQLTLVPGIDLSCYCRAHYRMYSFKLFPAMVYRFRTGRTCSCSLHEFDSSYRWQSSSSESHSEKVSHPRPPSHNSGETNVRQGFDLDWGEVFFFHLYGLLPIWVAFVIFLFCLFHLLLLWLHHLPGFAWSIKTL